MEKITSDELEEFKNLVKRFSKGDYSEYLSYEVAELLDKNCLPKKVGEHEFVMEGSLGDNERERIVLKDGMIDAKSDLHEITAQIDRITRMGDEEVSSYEDRVVSELYGGSTRITSENATGRMRNAVGPSLVDVRRSEEHEFNKDGVLTGYQREDKDKGIRESLSVRDGKASIEKNDEVYEFETDELLYDKENVKHVPINVDSLIKYLEAENSVSK